MNSYLSPKTEIRKSKIEGDGLFAAKQIRKGEVVGVKGGHVFDSLTLAKIRSKIGDSYFQITDNLFVGPLKKDEVRGSMMCLNHSCEPNVGIQGNIVFVSIRDIAAGEEITLDYAMCEDEEYNLNCLCGSKSCRKLITGKDWMIKSLQERYDGYFSAFLQRKIKKE